MTSVVATIDALRAEIIEAGPDALALNSRLGLRLREDEVAELRRASTSSSQSYAARPASADGELFGLYVSLHRLGRPGLTRVAVSCGCDRWRWCPTCPC